MRANFFVLCNFASQLANGSPIIAGVFRGVGMHRFPGTLDPFYIATEIEADHLETGDQEFEVRLIDEDGDIFYKNVIITNFEKRPDFAPSYMYFCGQVFVDREIQKPGVFRFDLVWQGEPIGQARLEIQA